MVRKNAIGTTSTVPAEVLLAAGHVPIDVNNLFISSPDRERLVVRAERDGFPLNSCQWIKGIYGTCMEQGIDTVLCVTTGDCSNTLMLMEVLKLKGLRTIPFGFPSEPAETLMQGALVGLAETLGTGMPAAESVRESLAGARRLAETLDRLTWQDGLVSGFENHYWLVSSSDFLGDVASYETGLSDLLARAERRAPYADEMLRLAYIGVPPVFAQDLHAYIEQNGARVVFNEVQRQFSMPGEHEGLAAQYTRYTYPYSVFGRLADILPQLELRRVDGVIHYVQAFCHRGIADIIMRHAIRRPMLTLEGNADYILTQHARTRVEAFLDVLRRQRRAGAIPGGRAGGR